MRRNATRKSRTGIRFQPQVGVLECRQLLSADVLTYHNDNARSGLDTSETILTPNNVNPTTFGKLGFDAVDGKVDAQPLYKAVVAIPGQGIHNVLYVATEHDSVYAFDADTGTKLWQVSMLGPGEVPSDPVHGNQVTPEIGVTATPVIDPITNTMYVVAMSKLVSGSDTTYIQRIHALDITTGADKVAPKSIDSSITFPGAGPGGNGTNVVFNPMQYKERAALLLVNGVVYTSWASHSDIGPYTSWVIGFNAKDLGLASVLNLNPNGSPKSSFLDDGSGGGFWNSGGGPAADAVGNIYHISGNGPFDSNLNAGGFPTNGDFGNSFLKFTPTAGGLTVSDYFTPYNQQDLANSDMDVGSSGLTLVDIPDASGTIQHLMIGSGKDGNIYVVNRDNMGKFNSSSNNIYQELPAAIGGGELGSPVAFNGEVYFGAVGATLRAFKFVGGKLQATPASQTSNTFGYPGTTPAISSNGTTDGIVWAAENGSTAILHAYDASDLSKELYNSNQAANGRDQFGAGNKFITPTVANGKVYVATTDGVGVFGLLSQGSPTIVTGIVVNDGSAQRSMVTHLTVNFSGPVAIAPNAFELRRQDGALVGLNAAPAADGRSVVLTFTGSDVIGGSLADGLYTLTVHSDKIRDGVGQTLDGDANGTAGGDYVDAAIERLFGDGDGDGDVDNSDGLLFKAAYSKSSGQEGYQPFFNFNGDGMINTIDFAEMKQRYGMRI